MIHVHSARLLSLFLGLLLTLALVTPSSAAVDMFLKFGPPSNSAPLIVGESQDRDFKDTIDVLAWSWGASNSSSFAFGGGDSRVGRANFQDLSITKYVDKASAPLMTGVAAGNVYRDVTLSVRKAGANPLVYLTYELKDVRVSSYSSGGSGGEDRLTENITLNFAAVKVTYIPQKEDGSADTPVIFEWNVVTDSPEFDGTRSNPVSSNSAPVSTGVSVTVKD